MSTLPKEITEKFLTELLGSEDVTEDQVRALRALMESDKKLKADDLVAIFAPPEEAGL